MSNHVNVHQISLCPIFYNSSPINTNIPNLRCLALGGFGFWSRTLLLTVSTAQEKLYFFIFILNVISKTINSPFHMVFSVSAYFCSNPTIRALSAMDRENISQESQYAKARARRKLILSDKSSSSTTTPSTQVSLPIQDKKKKMGTSSSG